MKIIHTSDIHIDSPLTTRLPSDKVRERRRELLSGFSRMVEEAKLISADAVIIAGDLFDSERITKKALDTALDVIERAENITFLYLTGNHEGDALFNSTRPMPKNLVTFGKEWTYFTIGSVTIAGRSEIREGMFDSLALPEETKNIVVLHGELRDRTAAPETIGIKDAVGRGIDYMALGHYHSYSRTEIDERGYAVYSGTPEGRGFDEVGDKGYVIIDTDARRVESGFRKFAKRRLHIVKVDITGILRTSDIDDRVRAAVRDIPASDMVRIELVGGYSPELWKDTDKLCHDFSGSFYYFEVKDLSKIAINPEDYKYDKSLKGEFIRTVGLDDSLDDATKARVIACGINALMGEELFD
ncbi:MAG: DNA repair exonuclease [Clostridia bacterium]|nr:DNA repair exonuclease [Clostridia bacterium]